MSYRQTMRAVVLECFGDPDELRVRELPIPSPGRGEALVAVAACGVCGHDLLNRKGKLHDKLGIVIGHEIAGTVVSVGPAVMDLAVGDRVASRQGRSCHRCRLCRSGRETICAQGQEYGDALPGGYAEYVVVDESSLAMIPDGVAFQAAAIAACAIGTGLHALRLAGVEGGQRVAVTGASGGVGIHALQLARWMGAETVAITSSDSKLSELQDHADEVAVMERGAFAAQLRARNLQPDVVLDLTSRYTLDESLRAVKGGGTVAIVGNLDAGPVGIVPGAFIVRELRMFGSAGTTKEELKDSLSLIARGVIQPHIHDTLPLAEASRAHAILEARAASGRLVLTP
jgi:acryloyl-coenzyme A reductase